MMSSVDDSLCPVTMAIFFQLIGEHYLLFLYFRFSCNHNAGVCYHSNVNYSRIKK